MPSHVASSPNIHIVVCQAAAATVPITYIEPDGTERTVDAEIGKHLLQVAHDNNVELEGACVISLQPYGSVNATPCVWLTKKMSVCECVSMLIVILHVRPGACGGELACSTCHLIFEKKVFDTLPKMEEEEEDMLDLAFEVTETYVQCFVRSFVAVAAFIPSSREPFFLTLIFWYDKWVWLIVHDLVAKSKFGRTLLE